MRERLSQLSSPPAYGLSEFLVALFSGFDREHLRYCVLRNYEGFPDVNIGNDIDILIASEDLTRALRALQAIPGIRVVGYAQRHYVANVFIVGVSPAPGVRALEIDFDLSLTRKGLPYLPTNAVLDAAVRRQAGNLSFYVPSPTHQAIISLFSSLLMGGRIKEKYFPSVQQVFAGEREQVLAALCPQFGSQLTERFLNAVVVGDQSRILHYVRSLRAALTFRSLLSRPIRNGTAFLRHYIEEIGFRLSPQMLETVVLLSPDHSTQTAMADALMPMLCSMTVSLERRAVKPCMPTHQDPASSPALAAGLAPLFFREWLYQFIGKRHLTLRLETYLYRDLRTPQQLRYVGRGRLVRLFSKLFPVPDLCIWLDQKRTSTDPRAALVPFNRLCILSSQGHAIEEFAEAAYAAIVETCTRRASYKLARRL